MRNLKLVDKIKCQINCDDKIKNFLIDPNLPKLNILLQTENNVLSYDCETDSNKEVFVNSAKIIDWEYLALNNEICMACEDGEVLVLNLGNSNVESVTFCEGGIERMCWSPDQEVVIFVTKSKNVVAMNCTYDPITESCLDDEAFGDQEFITVGWGKKETQFHGSEGKAAAQKKSTFVPVEDLSSLDPSISITWRGDGEFFAVSFVASYGRTFKVYNKEGQLQYTAEKLNHLGESIAWRPSGNWIAVPQKLPNKYTIGLFEKNGLRHREVVLPFSQDEEPVASLSWSNDSDVLAIETTKDGRSNVYLYTISNYHWYLKQSLNFERKISAIHWDSGFNDIKTLHVLLDSGTYVKYRWTLETFITSGNTFENLCIASVIDGNQLLLTDFRNNVIPPPMFKCALKCEENINATGFKNNQDSPRKLFVVTSQGKLQIYSITTQQNSNRPGERMSSVELLKVYDFIDESMSCMPLNYSHWIWLNDEKFVFCEVNCKESMVFLIDLNTGEKTSQRIADQIVAACPVSVTSFLVHTVNGDVLGINVESNELSLPEPLMTLPEYCEQLQALEINNILKCFALKNNQNLYINDDKVATGVTSFYLHEHYLVFTQLSSINFIRLDKLHNPSVISERRIERGGKIVAIIPKDSVTILQMPRGNLEAMQPRVLSLHIIRELLDAAEYQKVMLLLRKQRINLNIMFDHNPKQFVSNIETFFTQITNPHWLNLFITELENEDHAQTTYTSNYRVGETNYPEDFKLDEKVTYVCDYLCKIMKSKNDNKFIQPIITAYVKKGEIENALDLIWNLKEGEVETPNPLSPKRSNSEDALKYLLYMVDVDSLYDIALGMYNLPLVVFVAKHSQKDPKEYLQFLRELHKLEENYKRFKIDDYLKRYEKAFQNIANCGADRFDETLVYVQKHNLYTSALERFENDDQGFYKRIALLFADYLRTAGKIDNAGVMYERGGDLKQAIVSAKHVLDVERCLMLARAAEYSADETRVLALSLVPGLQANSRQQDAFHLMKQYGNNLEEALETLLDGRHYTKAIFEARIMEASLIEKTIKPHLAAYAILLKSTVEADKDKFLQHTNRLKILREKKASKPEDEEYVDEGDLISEATSVSSKYTGTSRSSGKTFRSSKNRRKHERKLLNLKEGSKFEDIALIDALYKLIHHIFDQQQHIHNICKAFIEVRFDGEGRLLQKSYGDLLKLVKDKLDEIWIPEMMNAPLQTMGVSIDYAQVLNDQHYAMIPPQERFKPQLNIIDWEHSILK